MECRRQFIKTGVGITAGAALSSSPLVAAARVFGAPSDTMATPLPGSSVSQFVEPLPTFSGSRVTDSSLTVEMQEFQQRVLPASLYATLPAPYHAGTFVWGYKVGPRDPSYPGWTIEARRGTPTTIRYINNLPTPAVESQLAGRLTIDQTIHWADPQGQMGSPKAYRGAIPTVVHLHGAQVPSASDGAPEAWFTADGRNGPAYGTAAPTSANAAVFRYPNEQPATALWFHDHALGLTRINVFAGLAAIYLLRDAYDTGRPDNPLALPAGEHEVELLIQDRQFDRHGQLFFPNGSPADNPAGLNGPPPNPAVHPYWIPEFFGDVMVVNGKSWPYLEVEPRRYRFRVVNGCNARFLQMHLVGRAGGRPAPPLWQIGTDGGLLDRPIKLLEPHVGAHQLFLAPAERADIIVDFSKLTGQQFTLVNAAPAPYPGGDYPEARTTGQVMQFRVTRPLAGQDATYDPAGGRPLRGGAGRPPAIVRLADPATGMLGHGVRPSVTRQLVLVEVEGPGGPIEVLLNNTKWSGLREGTDTVVAGARPTSMGPGMAGTIHGGLSYLTELPRVGSTELWELVNLTEDAHPIHVHLIQFQLLNRQYVDTTDYRFAYDAAFPGGRFAGLRGDGSWGAVQYEAGTYIPGYGPPLTYMRPNAGGALGGNPDITPYLVGLPVTPAPSEAGWKDTIKVFPGQVTRIVARWAPTLVPVTGVGPGRNLYGFDATRGPGYVWHCHILDHEDNEMMRPYAPVE
jgi:FtsP/CotA-like multicopper oxidase with cupredoxin domain